MSLKIDELDLSWLPEKWRKLITGKSSTTALVTEIHRLYFELCVLSQVVNEIKSEDLFVENSEQYSDYRDQLISWDQYKEQVNGYRNLVGLATSSVEFVAKLRNDLAETAAKTDRHFPENELVEITKDGLVIRKHDKNPRLPRRVFPSIAMTSPSAMLDFKHPSKRSKELVGIRPITRFSVLLEGIPAETSAYLPIQSTIPLAACTISSQSLAPDKTPTREIKMIVTIEWQKLQDG